jgi:hypothetical protein
MNLIIKAKRERDVKHRFATVIVWTSDHSIVNAVESRPKVRNEQGVN